MPYKSETVKSTVEDALSCYSDFDDLASEMGEWRDNMSGTGLESTDKYSRVDEAASSLEDINSGLDNSIGGLMDEIPDDLKTKNLEYTILMPPSKKQSPSRAYRSSNASSAIRAGLEAIQEWVDTEKDKTLEQDKSPDFGNIQSLLDEIEDKLSDADNIDFPGMFN